MEASSQTDAIEVSNQATQSITTTSQEVEAKVNDESTSGASRSDLANSSSLVRFLRSAEEILKQEINSSILVSKELNSILQSLLLSQAAEFTTVQLHTLYSDHLVQRLGQEEGEKSNLVVSAIEWNCSSSVLVVGYQVAKHSHYCDHESFLCIWSLFRSYTRESHPSSTIEIDGCVTAICSHPTLSSIFAVATASGHVQVIDSQFGSSNNSLSTPTASSVSHEEGVSFLAWVTELGFLVSLGYDGRILVWKYDVPKRSLVALKQYSILTSDLPKTICKDPMGKSKVGISAAAIVSRGASSCKLAIGCWGGGVLLSSLEWKEQEGNSSGKGVLEVTESPVVFNYAPHRSNITSVNVWRENPLFFITSSSDGELRVHHVNQSKPIAVYHCESNVLYASWSLCHPFVYCLLEDSPTVTVINFNANEEEENRLINRQSDLTIRNQSENVTKFWLNSHKGRQEEMALAWSSGDIKVVHLNLQ